MKIKLYDGTRTPDFGNLLFEVLLEIAEHQRIFINPLPGKTDVKGYNFIRSLADQSFFNGKVNIDRLIEKLENVPDVRNNSQRRNIILLNNDLCADAVNWCFGAYTEQNNLGYLVVSNARTMSDTHLKHVLAHEAGHMFGAPSEGRKNTRYNLGLHCTTPNCVMQQQTSIEESLKYALKRAKSCAQLYCKQCLEDMRSK